MKKLDVNQELCRKVQIMLTGAKMGEVAKLLGISKTTVSRIKTAGFNPEQYARNTQKRVEEENKAEADPEPEQVAGQICMELQPAEEQKPEMSDQTKLMRFQESQADKIIGQMMVNVDALLMKLDRLNDTLSMILRKLDG